MLHFSKLQNWNLTIRWFSVISRTLVGRGGSLYTSAEMLKPTELGQLASDIQEEDLSLKSNQFVKCKLMIKYQFCSVKCHMVSGNCSSCHSTMFFKIMVEDTISQYNCLLNISKNSQNTKIFSKPACKKRQEILETIFIKAKQYIINKICYDMGILKCL